MRATDGFASVWRIRFVCSQDGNFGPRGERSPQVFRREPWKGSLPPGSSPSTGPDQAAPRSLRGGPACSLSGCSSFPQSQSFGGGGAGWILSSTFLPLSPHENLNQGCREETFHTKSRQTGGTSTVSSLTCFKERKMNRRGKKIE